MANTDPYKLYLAHANYLTWLTMDNEQGAPDTNVVPAVDHVSVVAPTTYKYRNAEQRREYMRRYMANRRHNERHSKACSQA